MLIKFDEIQDVSIPNLNDGNGVVTAKMFMEPTNKIMISRLPVGVSIGMHEHTTSSEINYVISGFGKAICNDMEEELKSGVCHYCPKGSSHSIINTGAEDLILFTVAPEQ